MFVTPRAHLSDAMLVVLARHPERAAHARVASHLARCARCRTLLDRFRMLRESMSDPPMAPGRSVLASVFSLAEARPARGSDASRMMRARLLHDSGPLPAAQGLRTESATREQLWRIPGADVDVRIQPPGLGSPGVLHGQLFPLRRDAVAVEDGGVWLIEKGRRSAWSPLGDHGEFELPAPSVTRWALWLEWRGVRVRLEVD